ncbi:MAG: DUF2997 domain-containing protein [Anaeromyxobacteraceae bacterium]
MADKIEIEVTLSPEGEVRLVTHGLKGQSCVAETEVLEKALGAVTKRERTSEFYQQATAVRSGVKTR